MRKAAIIILLYASTSLLLTAQEYVHDTKIEQEINEQVWKPFKKAFESNDWKTFNDLHTDDVLRVSSWSGIKVGDEYKERVKRSYQRPTQQKRTIDFWLEHRIYSATMGYEVGYYRVISEEPGKDRHISYSQFHVVLRKENGVWKIAQDWDSSLVNSQRITKEDFEKGNLLDLK